MSNVIIIEGGRVIDPASGVDGVRTVVLRDGQVAEVAERADRPSGAAVIDARGKWVTPGFIDLHVHLREPGDEGKETILTGCRACEYTVQFPNPGPDGNSAPIALTGPADPTRTSQVA